MFTPASFPGVLHRYRPTLNAFEFNSEVLKNIDSPPTLIFVGGLGDGLLTVSLIKLLFDFGWSVVQVTLSSSYTGWGVVSIFEDALELSACASYFKGVLGRPKVVLMGHSTGSQDVLEYLCRLKPEEQAQEGVDGIILQSGISDRQAIMEAIGEEEWEESWKEAKKMIDEGRGHEIMDAQVTRNIFGIAPVKASRWYSISSPNEDAYEDFFSSDLPDSRLQKTFGSIRPKSTPVLICYSGNDEFVPKSVDKEALVQRWVDMCKKNEVNIDEENSGVIKGGTHSMKSAPEAAKEDLKRRIGAFLKQIE